MLFDTQDTGHHAEYVDHIVTHAPDLLPETKVIAVVPPRVVERVDGKSDGSNIQLIALDREAINRVHRQPNRWKRSFAEWNLAAHHARRQCIDHCILLDLNWFQAALGWPLRKDPSCTLSGIFFFPFVRMSVTAHSGTETLQWAGRYLRKWITMWWMLRNEHLNTVFVLNDPSAARQLNRWVDPSKRRFQSLPDPVPALSVSQDIPSLHEAYNLDENREVFLFTGTISKRKGVLVALDAFATLPSSLQKRCTFILAGRLMEDVREEVERRIHHLDVATDIEVRSDFRFLPEAELQRALSECDAIIAPYQRTEGSSGILGHAARARCPVIGPRSGLIGDLIQRYGLGANVDASKPEEIGLAIQRALHDSIEVDRNAMQRYLEERRPSLFAEQILNGIAL
jgi:glycosyltransferase involved in cell wall biosynthesis